MAPKNDIGIPIVTQKANRSLKNKAKTMKTRNSPLIAFLTSKSTRLCKILAASAHVVMEISSGKRVFA